MVFSGFEMTVGGQVMTLSLPSESPSRGDTIEANKGIVNLARSARERLKGQTPFL